MKLRDVLRKHPELKEHPVYDPDRYSKAFEDSLMMVAKEMALVPERANLIDVYTTDGIIKNKRGNVLFYYDAEYSNVDGLFTSDGKFAKWTVHIPLEKKGFFERFEPSVWIRGSKDLRWVLILRGSAILKYYKEISHPCSHVGINEKREFMEVHTGSMMAKGHLQTGRLQDWLLLVNKLFPLAPFLYEQYKTAFELSEEGR